MEKKPLKLLMPDFLKVHSITFYIELSPKYVGVGVNFAPLKENLSGDPQFLFFFLKVYIKVYEIKIKLRLLMPDFLKVHSITFYIELSSK